MTANELGDYRSPGRAQQYLNRAASLPHRGEGEVVLLELLPSNLRRVLDLGCGGGRLLALVIAAYPAARGIGLDFSPPMLAEAGRLFAGDPRVQLVEHDLNLPLPDLGRFDAVVSSFAIHHLSNECKFGVYRAAFACLAPGGAFCNLEHVASPSPELHADFYRALGTPVAEEDPANQLSPIDRQLGWLGQVGFQKVDCYWKWREFALLAGFAAPDDTA